MKNGFVNMALVALILCMSAGQSFSEEPQPKKAKPTSAAVKAKAAASNSKAAPARVEPVDINSASKEELKKLPGIGDADADKIIAGRPYLSKAHLQTHNIVSPGVYLGLQQLVVARQKDAKFAKPAKK